MSRTTKRRVLHAGLVLFTLWPLAHIYLVRRFNMSAWKLAGWGMYATPRPTFSGLQVLGRRPDSKQFEEIRSLPPRWQTDARHFLDDQRWLGRLLRPKMLARSLKHQMPEFADLRIVVFTPALDRQTGMIVVKPMTYEYVAKQIEH